MSQSDHYFCSVCGTLLTNELVRPVENFKRVLHVEKAPSDGVPLVSHYIEVFKNVAKILNLKKNMTKIVEIFIIFLGAGFLFLNSNYLILTSLVGVFTPAAPVTPLLVKESSSSVPAVLPPAGFYEADVLALVPSDVLIYGEALNLKDISKAFVETDSAYDGLSQDLVKNVSQHFSVYLTSTGQWVAVFLPVKQAYTPDLTNYPWLKSAKIGKYLVMSTSEDALKEATYSAASVSKNLSMNAPFVQKAKTLQPSLFVLHIFSSKAQGYLAKVPPTAKLADYLKNQIKYE